MRVNIITNSGIARCPKKSLLPAHYRDDGTCLCDEAEAAAREVAEAEQEMRAARDRLRSARDRKEAT